MSDRNRDRHDAYNDGQYGHYDNGRYPEGGYYDDRSYEGGYYDNRSYDARSSQYGESGRRPSRSSDGYYGADAQQSARSYSRQSGAYPSSGSSSAAGAYAETSRTDNAARRSARNSDAAGYPSDSANLFGEHFSDDEVNMYRRSAYSSGASGRSSASKYSRSSSRSSTQPPVGATVVPAQQRQGSRSSYTRNASSGNYAPKRSNRKRNIIIAAVIVLAVVLVGAGMAWAYVNSISNNLHEGVDQKALDALEPATPTETSLGEAPFYMLLMGVDMAGWRRDLEEYAGDQWGRSDSMILARVDPVNKKVALISIHRDTMVDLGEYGQQKINAAYEFYGPAGAIKAVSTMAGVPISHYATVDFDGFSAIVDTLGGIEVNVPMEINDDVLPAHIDAGWQTLNGEQALDLCRARHAYDDVADDGDVMRAANQRMVIGVIAKKILSSDIMTIANSVQTLSKYVTTDLELSDIVGLAQIFKDVDPDADIYTAMEPTTSAYINDTWYEYLDEDAWKEMIARMDQGLPPVNKTEIDARTGTVLSTGGADAPVV